MTADELRAIRERSVAHLLRLADRVFDPASEQQAAVDVVALSAEVSSLQALVPRPEFIVFALRCWQTGADEFTVIADGFDTGIAVIGLARCDVCGSRHEFPAPRVITFPFVGPSFSALSATMVRCNFACTARHTGPALAAKIGRFNGGRE